jgi:hypothetical protein
MNDGDREVLSGFKSALTCLFGKIEVGVAPGGDSGELICNTPPNPTNMSRSVAVSIMIYATSPIIIGGEDIQFFYEENPYVSHLSVASGPSKGGTVVDLYGVFVETVGSLKCRFGTDNKSILVNALYISSTNIQCITPPLGDINGKGGNVTNLLTAPIPVYITNNDQNFVHTGFDFNYYPSSTFLRVHPPAGPTDGGIKIRLYGKVSNVTREARCHFGQKATSPAYNFKPLVNTTEDVESSIECMLPASPDNQDTEVDVFFSNNGHDIERTGLTFRYYSTPGIIKIRPNIGIIHGGTHIEVAVVNFFESKDWFCVFGSDTAIRATYVDDSSLLCRSPESRGSKQESINITVMHVPDATADRITVNENILRRSMIVDGFENFKYVAPMRVIDTEPSVVFIGGGLEIIVVGENFFYHEEIFCVWNNDIRTVATFDMTFPDRLTCQTPQLEEAGNYKLSIAVNEQNEMDGSVIVRFVGQPIFDRFTPHRSIEAEKLDEIEFVLLLVIVFV